MLNSLPKLLVLPLHVELLAKVAGLASDLDALLEVFLKVSAVHDTILDRVGAINKELDLVLLAKLLQALSLALELLLARPFASGLLLSCCWRHFFRGRYSETRYLL